MDGFVNIQFTKMILIGTHIISKGMVKNILNDNQIQACGIDFTLKRVYQWSSGGVFDLNNKLRQLASKEEICFNKDEIYLKQGSYLI